jgi:hypothetical protein
MLCFSLERLFLTPGIYLIAQYNSVGIKPKPELIQAQITQKPLLWVQEMGAHVV